MTQRKRKQRTAGEKRRDVSDTKRTAAVKPDSYLETTVDSGASNACTLRSSDCDTFGGKVRSRTLAEAD